MIIMAGPLVHHRHQLSRWRVGGLCSSCLCLCIHLESGADGTLVRPQFNAPHLTRFGMVAGYAVITLIATLAVAFGNWELAMVRAACAVLPSDFSRRRR
jgi:hypothetical protein